MSAILGLGLVAAGLLFVANTSLWTEPMAARPHVLAHRGMGQEFDLAAINSDDCTAVRMLPPQHDFIENTLRSIEEAFRLGADVVELDVHQTKGGGFAVFHDWTLDCRTNGSGVTREHAMAELKALDIGYGYTADGGKTFPFRGKGVGLMPTLDEVLAAFPDRRLLINIKSNDYGEGKRLARRLRELPKARRDLLMAYGGDAPMAALGRELPEMRTMSRGTLRGCILRYLAFGWSGYVPSPCRDTIVLVPANVGPWLWGWPHRYQRRLAAHNSVIFAVAPYHGGGFSQGIDSESGLRLLPPRYSGGIWTDRIDVVAPLVGRMGR